jgi:hypothetical protein
MTKRKNDERKGNGTKKEKKKDKRQKKKQCGDRGGWCFSFF